MNRDCHSGGTVQSMFKLGNVHLLSEGGRVKIRGSTKIIAGMEGVYEKNSTIKV